MRRLTLLLASLISLPAVAFAGQTPAGPPPLRVYLDCYECDTEFLRQNVVFVDYMRDRTDADLHVLVTTQGTGSGGSSWTMKVIGLGRFQSADRTVIFTTPQSASSDERRREFARRFRLAMAGYAAETSVGRDLDLTWKPPAATAQKALAKDRWDSWVFRLSGNGNFNGEASSKYSSYRYSLSAGRVTEALKVNMSANYQKNDNTYTLTSGTKVKSLSDSWNLGGTIVKSAGPRFSLGARVNASHSSFSNTDRSVAIYPGFEFNFFPYAESQRRRLSIWYEIGPNFYRYTEPTIYDKTSERVAKQQMDVSLRTRQPWGSASIFASVSQHLAHLDRYSASIYGSTDVRLFKGFSFNIFAEYRKIKDQISLAKGTATTEEVLLRLRQLATGYSYSFSAGFSYTFGSIFNSVVNPRFGSY